MVEEINKMIPTLINKYVKNKDLSEIFDSTLLSKVVFIFWYNSVAK